MECSIIYALRYSEDTVAEYNSDMHKERKRVRESLLKNVFLYEKQIYVFNV